MGTKQVANLIAGIACLLLFLLLVGGGRPSKGTPRDQRLKINNPNAGKKPIKPKPAPIQKGK